MKFKYAIRIFIILSVFIFQFANASEVQMATSEDLREFDTLIKPDRNTQKPNQVSAPTEQTKKLNPRANFEGRNNPGQQMPPPKPFDQRPPPGAGAAGDGNAPPPPTGSGNPPPPPPPPPR